MTFGDGSNLNSAQMMMNRSIPTLSVHEIQALSFRHGRLASASVLLGGH